MMDVRLALYSLAGLVAGFIAHEYAQARATQVFGDFSPRRAGRVTANPLAHADPLGTYILPGLLLLLIAAGKPFTPPFAYGKPMPVELMRRRDYCLALLAGPASNLGLAVLSALSLRVFPRGEAGLLAGRFLVTNVMLCVFNLMPLPPLDGSKVLARFLSPKARHVINEMQPYGGLFMIAVFFLLSAPVMFVVDGLGNGLCNVLVGVPCL